MTTWTFKCPECRQPVTEELSADAQVVYDACLVLHQQGAKITQDTVFMVTKKNRYADSCGGWLQSLWARGLLERLPGISPSEYRVRGAR